MVEQLKAAAVRGVVIGVQIVAALAVVLLCAGWVFGDYAQLRSGVAELQRVVKNVCAVSMDANGTSLCAEHRPPPAEKPPAEAPKKP